MKVAFIPYVQGRNSYSDIDGLKYGVAIHNTSNDAPAKNEASYATRRTDGTSAHFYADPIEVIQSLDTTARAGHAGSSNGNQHAVAVEITGTNDKSRDWWLTNVNWVLLGRVLAEVCKLYGVQVRRAAVTEMRSNPKVKAFYSHDDMRQAWGGTDHTDPGNNFPWDRLFQVINAALAGEVTNSSTVGGKNMMVLARAVPGEGPIWLCDGIRRRIVPEGLVASVQWLGASVAIGPLWNNGAVWEGAELNAFGAPDDSAEVAARDAASAARESAMVAALTALASGGTNVDTAVILAAVDAAGEEAEATVRALQAELEEKDARLAAALNPPESA